jgi:glucosamine-6-phosphate deaminase
VEVIISPSAEEASELAARKIKNQIRLKPSTVLGLATGSTPLKMYEKFIQMAGDESLDLTDVKSFNLDEYVGVSEDHAGSYAHYMEKNWLTPLKAFGLKPENFFIPKGQATSVVEECSRYEQLIANHGPIDLQILGIGRDGHIGFNEPGSSFGSRTRLKTLTETTRADNSSLFSDSEEIPRHVMTMGIQTILEAEEILLLAFGHDKAEAVKMAVEGPVSALVPASILQFHPKVKIFLDGESSAGLSHKSYYREVFNNKPPWQMAEFI